MGYSEWIYFLYKIKIRGFALKEQDEKEKASK
jgi:hypothetical protein